MPLIRTVRRRFFLAVEGESEQSFAKWLQFVANERNLNIHLQYRVLSGGGFSSMLRNACAYRDQEKRKGKVERSFLIVDEDRASSGIDWPVERLKREAGNNGLSLYIQKPNFEGGLIRMLPGREQAVLSSANAKQQIFSIFPNYQKPIDARMLMQKFSIEDLLRTARYDADLMSLLSAIGFI